MEAGQSFFEREGVVLSKLGASQVPLGIEKVTNTAVGIGGAYGAWGESYDNPGLAELLSERLGEKLEMGEMMNLGELGFNRRHHIAHLTDQEHLEVELEVGAAMLRAAAEASGWQPGEVEGVLVGVSGPVSEDYTEQIALRAGIPASAVKVSLHKACDSSVGGLHLVLNPDLPFHKQMGRNLAEELYGKKVLVGGIEGLSRFMRQATDKNALQLFGNGAGVLGLVPGESLKFLVGRTHENYDEEGVLAVRMCYPHSRELQENGSMVEVSQAGLNHFRLAGFMHEPDDPLVPVVMAGPMGMVKLFVRTGVQVVREVYQAYQSRLAELDLPGREVAVAIVHHANFKINKLIEKHLQKDGVQFPMPWLLSEFGNVSAASNMIAFLRHLPNLKPGEHVLVDGFGAGTYYDALVVEAGG